MPRRLPLMAAVVLALVAQTMALLALTAAPASAAPLGLQAGDLVISDSGHNQVIVVPADGGADRVLTTDVDSPGGLAVTPTGDVIVADTGNDRVIKVRADGTGFDVLRTGTWSVTHVAVDSQGIVYFVGNSWGGVGRVTLAGATRSTIGPGTPGLGGPSIASDGDVMFSSAGEGVFRMEADGTNVRSVPGFPPASTTFGFNYTGSDIGPGDTFYVTETNDDVVWVGDGSADAVGRGTDLDNPQDVALRVDGTAIVADWFNDRVVAIAPDGNQTVVATDSPLLKPMGVAVAPVPPADVGDVFVATASGDVVRTSATGSDGVAVATGLGTLTDVAVDEAGNAFASNTDGQVYEISADAESVQLLFDRTSSVTAVAVGPGDILYFTEDPGGVRSYTEADGVQDVASDGGTPLVGLTVDASGLPYATTAGTVSRVQGGGLDPLAPDFVDSAGVTWDPAGRLLVAHHSQAQLAAVDTGTGDAVVVATVGGIRDVTVAGDGRLLTISDGGNVARLDADGSNLTVLTSISGVRGIDTYSPRPAFTAGGPVTGTGNVGTAYPPYDFDADGNGGGTVDFTTYSGALPPGLSLSSSTGVLDGTPTTPGTYSFRVQAANGARGVVSAEQTVEVGKQLQTITFTSTIPTFPNRVPDRTYEPTATATSGGPVTFSIDAGSATVCSYDSGTGLVTFLGGGTCTVRADQAGDADFEPGTGTQSMLVDRLSQSAPVYDESLPTGVRVGDTYLPTASAPGPGTAVEFVTTFVFTESFDPRCEYDSATGAITFTHAGTCRLRAFRPQSDRYNFAQSANRNITVLPALLGFAEDAPATPRAGEFYVLSSNDPDASYDIDYGATDFDTDLGEFVCTVGFDGALDAYVAYFHSPGTCGLSVYSDDDYTPNSDTITLTILKAAQTVTFTSTAPTAAVVGDTYDPTATSPATGAVTYAVSAASDDVCSYVSGTVTFDHAGDCVVRAEHPGDDDFDAGSATQTITVGKASQSISFTSTVPTAAVVGDGYTPMASATSGGTVAFSIATGSAGVCSITGGTVWFDHVGDCVVQADQAGDADHLAAPTVDQTVTVGKASQAIVFNSPADTGVVGGTYDPTPAATATSGEPVAYAIAAGSAGVCSISGGSIDYDHVGDCVVELTQAGNADYLAAPSREMTIVVGQGSQTIAFTSTPPATPVVGGTYTPSATATSGGTVEFSIASASAGVCTLASGEVTFDGAGDCVVRADQSGNADYLAAPQEVQTITVGRIAQTVAFTSTAPIGALPGDTYVVAATATSGEPVSFSIAPASASRCSIAGTTVTLAHGGDCVVRADQGGSSTHLAAPTAEQTVTVGRRSTSVSFTSVPPAPAVVGQTYGPTAEASPLATVLLGVATPDVCSISGGTVSFDHAGTCEIRASWPDDGDHVPSVASQSVAVEPAATELEVELLRDVVLATVTVVEPGGGTPTGEVVFTDHGEEIGTAELFVDTEGDVVAALTGALAAGASHEVAATYLGSDDHLGSTAETVTRTDPTITAHVKSWREPTRFGWYRNPVRITFTCTEGTAPLVGGCPGLVKLTKNRRGVKPITAGVSAEDGGAAQVDVTVRIDRTDPRLKVRGVKAGKTYDHKQKLRCVARDQLSGIAKCTRTQKVVTKNGRDVVRFKVVAVDRAGNTTTEKGKYYLR